jgi:putative ubiquitin-RnfH superfamily antitoxin RatB of RatAB toxin-antitoxin module
MNRICVEIVYALADRRTVYRLQVACTASLRDAIVAGGLIEQFPEIDSTRQRVGVFGRLAELSDALREGDRVEIYRPLLTDPKQARLRRASHIRNRQEDYLHQDSTARCARSFSRAICSSSR